jgi:phosphoglycerate kinase
MSFRTLDDVDARGKRVLVRVDLNVPTENGRVTDATRIDRILPTIREIAGHGGRVVLLAHFGRPRAPARRQTRSGSSSTPCPNGWGSRSRSLRIASGRSPRLPVASLADGHILLLENTRFHPGEEKNEPGFVADLAKLGDLYVNDAFSAAHRAHASTEGLARVLPAYAGRTMQAELEALAKGLESPRHPVVAIVGGAKVSTKIDLLENLVGKVDALVIGGGMANTFLHAIDIGIGRSLAERDLAGTALRILERARETGCAIILPVDGIVASEFKAGAPHHAYGIDAIPSSGMILDVGSQSVERINSAINDAATLVWNGPLGAFEIAPFDQGTVAAARHAAERTKAGKLVSVAGGGDTVAALNHAGVADDFTYVSTAGGAFLEWLEGKVLPGVEALKT